MSTKLAFFGNNPKFVAIENFYRPWGGLDDLFIFKFAEYPDDTLLGHICQLAELLLLPEIMDAMRAALPRRLWLRAYREAYLR